MRRYHSRGRTSSDGVCSEITDQLYQIGYFRSIYRNLIFGLLLQKRGCSLPCRSPCKSCLNTSGAAYVRIARHRLLHCFVGRFCPHKSSSRRRLRRWQDTFQHTCFFLFLQDLALDHNTSELCLYLRVMVHIGVFFDANRRISFPFYIFGRALCKAFRFGRGTAVKFQRITEDLREYATKTKFFSK